MNVTTLGRDDAPAAGMQSCRNLMPLATHRGDFRRNWQMSKAMEQIVQVYVRHQNRRAFKDLRKRRQKFALELSRARQGYDFGLPVRQINDEIAVIEAGLERLVIATKAA